MIIEIKALKNTALTLVYPAYDGEWSSQYVSSPAGLDSEISQDKGSFADCTNEWTEIGTTGVGTIDLTAAEMNVDLVIVKTTSSTTGVNFPLVVIHTYTDPLEIANTELSAVPASTASLRQMQQFNFELNRHKFTENKDTGAGTLYKDDGSTPLGTRTDTDDGTTVTRGEMT